MVSLPLAQIQQSPAAELLLCILVSKTPFYFLALLKVSLKEHLPGQCEACECNSVRWHISLHAAQGFQEFVPSRCPLLMVSQQTGDHSCRLGKRKAEWPRSWLLHGLWSKIPMKPNRASQPEQATATDTAPELRGKYLIETNTHCTQSKRFSKTNYSKTCKKFAQAT